MSDYTLVLMRHGKSDYPPDVDDIDRPLAPRGRRQAARTATFLDETAPVIDRVLCSTALRARQTLAEMDLTARVTFSRGLYGASVQEILAEVRLVDASVRTLLVVAHAPGLPDLAQALAGAHSEAAAMQALAAGMPTAAVAILTAPGPWAAWQPGGPRLRYAGRPD